MLLTAVYGIWHLCRFWIKTRRDPTGHLSDDEAEAVLSQQRNVVALPLTERVRTAAAGDKDNHSLKFPSSTSTAREALPNVEDPAPSNTSRTSAPTSKLPTFYFVNETSKTARTTPTGRRSHSFQSKGDNEVTPGIHPAATTCRKISSSSSESVISTLDQLEGGGQLSSNSSKSVCSNDDGTKPMDFNGNYNFANPFAPGESAPSALAPVSEPEPPPDERPIAIPSTSSTGSLDHVKTDYGNNLSDAFCTPKATLHPPRSFFHQKEDILHSEVFLCWWRNHFGNTERNSPTLRENWNVFKLAMYLHSYLFDNYPEGLILPDTLTRVEMDYALNYLQYIQKVLVHKYPITSSIVLAQKLILLDKNQNLGAAIEHDAEFDSSLIIGVDATPVNFGGYCVNLKEGTIEYYSVSSREIPWALRDSSCSNEFEMKNLIFALSVWHAKIEENKALVVHTDNIAINRESDLDGGRARSLLKHFVDCKGIKINTGSILTRRKEDVVGFARVIQPADDFSRCKIQAGVEFLAEYYGIDKGNIKGTCLIQVTESMEDHLTHTLFHHEVLNTAEAFARTFECRDCADAVDFNSYIRMTYFRDPMSPPENGPSKGKKTNKQHKTNMPNPEILMASNQTTQELEEKGLRMNAGPPIK